MHICFALRCSQVHLRQAISLQRDPLHKVEPRNGLEATSCWRQLVPQPPSVTYSTWALIREALSRSLTVTLDHRDHEGRSGICPHTPMCPADHLARAICHINWLHQINHHERVTLQATCSQHVMMLDTCLLSCVQL